MQVSPLLNDSLAAARLDPAAFVREFDMACGTDGCWTSDRNAVFHDDLKIRLRAYWRGDEVAAEVVLGGGMATVTPWNSGLALAKIDRAVLPVVIERSLTGHPMGTLIGPSVLDRPEYVIRWISQGWDDRIMVLFDCVAEPLREF